MEAGASIAEREEAKRFWTRAIVVNVVRAFHATFRL